MNNPAFHATLEIKQIKRINADTQDMVRLKLACHDHLKMRGKNSEGVEIYLDLELIGTREDLDKYHLDLGNHAGFVMRVVE